MRRTLTLFLAAMCCMTYALAQDAETRVKVPYEYRRMEVEELNQLYSRTRNTAGMGLSQPSSGSFTTLGAFAESGEYHRAQEGGSDMGFEFSSKRYDSFSDKLFMKGSFRYALDNEKGRAWSDVIDPYFSNPFIYGCQVAKDYGRHDCEIDFDLYTAPLNGLVSFGLKGEYQVKDIYGNRDPRPRTGYLRYEIIPSVLFSFGSHHVGIDAGFTHSKEKLQNLTTIQSYPNLWYYKMSGLDRIDGAISAYSGFKRQFIANGFVSDLSYSYSSGQTEFLLNGGVAGDLSNAYGDKKQCPGSYNSLTYTTRAELLLKGGRQALRMALDGSMTDGGADENLQELTSVKDPVTGATTETWETLYTYKNRYMLRKYDAGFVMDYYGQCTRSGYKWGAGAELRYAGFRKECFLPYSSFMVDALDAELRGSYRLLERGFHLLDLELSVNHFKPLRSDLTCAAQNVYVDEVLVPDQAFYSAPSTGIHACLAYHFPMRLGRAGRANGYIRLEGGHTASRGAGNLNGIAITFGLFTF